MENTNQISAKIIADSKNEYGNRITTFVLVMPRIILAEFNTHRMISRNSASSRAIPFEKMLKTVKETPFIPIKWMKDHSGMQGTEYFEGQEALRIKNQWIDSRWRSMESAEKLAELGVSKQICNRLLEPFMYHTVIATGTEWENFFALRAHEAAEIHMQDLAYKMLEEYNKSTPKELKVGEWHIPFGDKIDEDKALLSYERKFREDESIGDRIIENCIKIATARCARVSYTVVGEEGKEANYENDIKLHDRLLTAGHMSPFEHCAKCPPNYVFWEGKGERKKYFSGNFQGFQQYRKTLQGENKTDNRVKK
jgi:thymidylate synthase ThyX